MLLDLGSGAVGPLQAIVDPAAHRRHPRQPWSSGPLRRPCIAVGAAALRPRAGHGPRAHIRCGGPRASTSGSAKSRDRVTMPGWRRSHGRPSRQVRAGALGPFTVTAARAWHPVPALAYPHRGAVRVRAARRRLVFTGDTDLSDEVAALAGGRPAARRGGLGAPRREPAGHPPDGRSGGRNWRSARELAACGDPCRLRGSILRRRSRRRAADTPMRPLPRPGFVFEV